MGYHTKNIEKGVLGEISKLEEEKEELNDNSGSKILILCELSDYYGALIRYIENKSIMEEEDLNTTPFSQHSLDLKLSMERFNYHHNKITTLEVNGERDKIPPVIHSIVSDINSIANIFNMDIEEIKKFSKMTTKAFEEGHRGYEGHSVKRPKHYSENDPFKIMEDNCTFEEIMGAAKLNVVKYALRKKNQDKEDWKKIIHYAEWALKQYTDE